MKWDTLPDRFFSDEFLEEIFKTYSIEISMKKELQTGLESSAKGWFHRQNSPEEMISSTVARKTLDRLSRDADALKYRLKNIPDVLWTSMIDTRKMVNPNSHGIGLGYVTPHYPEYGCAGEPGIKVVTEGSTGPFQTVEISTIIDALSELALFAHLTPQMNPPKNIRAQKKWPLQKWIVDMHNLWAGPLGRKFTRDVTSNGEPISEAACFCVDVYKVLDPETDVSSVTDEMKKQIKAYNDFCRDHPDWKK